MFVPRADQRIGVDEIGHLKGGSWGVERSLGAGVVESGNAVGNQVCRCRAGVEQRGGRAHSRRLPDASCLGGERGRGGCADMSAARRSSAQVLFGDDDHRRASRGGAEAARAMLAETARRGRSARARRPWAVSAAPGGAARSRTRDRLRGAGSLAFARLNLQSK